MPWAVRVTVGMIILLALANKAVVGVTAMSAVRQQLKQLRQRMAL